LAWVIINNRVYDIQAYMPYAPCGLDSLKAFIGKDATKAFMEAAHSDFAHELLEQCLVGSYRQFQVHIN